MESECEFPAQGNSVIRHQGIVQSWSSGRAKVLVLHENACGACKAQDSCTAISREGAVIDIVHALPLAEGQRVDLMLRKHLDWGAIVLVFLVPVALMLGTVLAGGALLWPDVVSGAAALGVFILYLLVLSMLRKRLDRLFTMKITIPEPHT